MLFFIYYLNLFNFKRISGTLIFAGTPRIMKYGSGSLVISDCLGLVTSNIKPSENPVEILPDFTNNNNLCEKRCRLHTNIQDFHYFLIMSPENQNAYKYEY